jgi:hypothetical protein
MSYLEHGMSLPTGTWLRAWRLFIRWSGLDIDPHELTVIERWHIVSITVPAGVRAFYARPARHWLMSRLPAWWAMSRLKRASGGWYRIPTWSVAEHCMFRFGHPGLDVGTLLKIRGGAIVATAHVMHDRCEILFYAPNGEVENEPDVFEMRRAWQARSPNNPSSEDQQQGG